MSSCNDVRNTTPPLRWLNQEALSFWVNAFAKAFPRHANRAPRIAAVLAGYTDYAALLAAIAALPKHIPVNSDSLLYTHGALTRFHEDRQALVNECDLSYQTADIFLSMFPVGAEANATAMISDMLLDAYPFDEQLAYRNAMAPAPDQSVIDPLLDRQFAAAQMKTGQGYTHGTQCDEAAMIIHHLMNHCGHRLIKRELGTAPAKNDTEALLRAGVTDLYAGSITTNANIDFHFFTAPYQFDNNWGRNTVFNLFFYSSLSWLAKSDSYCVVWNQRPIQLLVGDHVYTCFGWILTPSKPVPMFLHAGADNDLEGQLLQSLIDQGKPQAQSEDVDSTMLRTWLTVYRHVTGRDLNLSFSKSAIGWTYWDN